MERKKEDLYIIRCSSPIDPNAWENEEYRDGFYMGKFYSHMETRQTLETTQTALIRLMQIYNNIDVILRQESEVAQIVDGKLIEPTAEFLENFQSRLGANNG